MNIQKRLIMKIVATVFAFQSGTSAFAVKFEKAPSLREQELLDGFARLRPEYGNRESLQSFFERMAPRMTEAQIADFAEFIAPLKMNPYMPAFEIQDNSAIATFGPEFKVRLRGELGSKMNINLYIDDEKFVVTPKMDLAEILKGVSATAKSAFAKRIPKKSKQSLWQTLILPQAQAFDISEAFSNINWVTVGVTVALTLGAVSLYNNYVKSKKYTCPQSANGAPLCCGTYIPQWTDSNGVTRNTTIPRPDTPCCNHFGKQQASDGVQISCDAPTAVTVTAVSPISASSAGAASAKAVPFAPSASAAGKASAAVVKKPSDYQAVTPAATEGQK